jgi:hypothetical protein
MVYSRGKATGGEGMQLRVRMDGQCKGGERDREGGAHEYGRREEKEQSFRKGGEKESEKKKKKKKRGKKKEDGVSPNKREIQFKRERERENTRTCVCVKQSI